MEITSHDDSTVGSDIKSKMENIAGDIPDRKVKILNELNQVNDHNKQCNICNKMFSYIKALEAHMKIHTGQKPYVCNICQKSFSAKGDLKKHQKMVVIIIKIGKYRHFIKAITCPKTKKRQSDMFDGWKSYILCVVLKG